MKPTLLLLTATMMIGCEHEKPPVLPGWAVQERSTGHEDFWTYHDGSICASIDFIDDGYPSYVSWSGLPYDAKRPTVFLNEESAKTAVDKVCRTEPTK